MMDEAFHLESVLKSHDVLTFDKTNIIFVSGHSLNSLRCSHLLIQKHHLLKGGHVGHVEQSQVAKNWRIKILQLTIFMSQNLHHRKLDQHTNHVEKSGGDAHATNI